MKLNPIKLAPALIASCVIATICLLQLANLDFVERLEQMTYDMRARLALHFPAPAATNLGFVFISDQSIAALNNNSLGFRYGLYWPRQIYGRTYRELAAQQAKAVAFDVLFDGARLDQGQVPVSDTQWPDAAPFFKTLHPGQQPRTLEMEGEKGTFTYLDSDEFFAWQLRRGGTATLAAESQVLPLDLLATNAHATADIGANRDADGVLRRARAFTEYRRWHPAFRQAAAEGYVDLNQVRVETNQIVLLSPDGKDVAIPIDAQTNFDLTDFGGANLPAHLPRKARAFTVERLWHMGIVLAAQELKLDLDHAQIDLPHGQIVLRGPPGIERTIPVDEHAYFLINWELTSTDRRLTAEPFENLLAQDLVRTGERRGDLTNRWAEKLVIIGSNATGNDLTDRGATPLERDTFLVTKHWNVANSVITGRFVRPASLPTKLALIIVLGLLTALLTWQLRVTSATLSVLGLALVYLTSATGIYLRQRYWLPLVLPGVAVVMTQYVGLLAYRVIVEQTERRRVKSIFSKIVSPNIVNELLAAENLSLVGARREVTVFFADLRGFTEFTDKSQQQAELQVAQQQLTGAQREACFDEQARDALHTVNTYLSLVADQVKTHAGTLDKYIGDCVMAFWGAPTPNARHAADCVRAALDTQRAMYVLNRQRADYNQKLELENSARRSAGLPPKPLLPILLLGSGINTGMATVGLMGSQEHLSNYTVFGREVNLASRLEGYSGRGRVVISQSTYDHLQRDDPALAANCVALSEVDLKGFHTAIRVYEVLWRPPGSISMESEFFSKKEALAPANPA